MMRNAFFALLVLTLTACATAPATTTPPEPQSPMPATQPWLAEPLAKAAVPAVYDQQWSKAENRNTCALIGFRNVGQAGAGATPRAATFSGGWAVAYDLPNVRSAFGIAGTGATAGEPTYEWGDGHRWPDGSYVSWGPEGGTGPNQLAYLQIAGQGCLYNVWSRVSREHLEELLREIRFVR